MRNPNSSGTTTFCGSMSSLVSFTADSPYINDVDASGEPVAAAGTYSGIVLATNGMAQTRCMYTSPAAVANGVVIAEGSFQALVSQQSTASSNDNLSATKDNNVDGILALSTFGNSNEMYLMSLPSVNGRPAWLLNSQFAVSPTASFVVSIKCPSYLGTVQFRIYLLIGGNWVSSLTLSPRGATYIGGTILSTSVLPFTAVAIAVNSNQVQEILFDVTMFYTDDTRSFGVPRHQNLLLPCASQFNAEIESGTGQRFWPVAAGEVIKNNTQDLKRGGEVLGLSSQRFSTVYTAKQATTMDQLITYNNFFYYAGSARDGLSGHSIPRVNQPDPLAFHDAMFGSDCRLYLMISTETPQIYQISYATAICAFGKRSGAIDYGGASYPQWWPLVAEALVHINPMDCNPGHSKVFGKAYNYIRDFVSDPKKVSMLLDGAISTADLAQLALQSIAPRAAGAAGQLSAGLKMIR